MNKEEEKEFKELEKENEILRNEIDSILPIDSAENEDAWVKINLLIENEISQERYCE